MIISLIFFMAAARAFPEEESSPDVNQVELMIKAGYFMNKRESTRLIKYAADLDISNRTMLYQRNSKGKETVPAIFFNMILPGTGSFLIGDTSSGIILSLGTAVMAGITATSYFTLSSDKSLSVLYIAGGILSIFYVYGIISPMIYIGEWNYQLKKGLGLSALESRDQAQFYADSYFRKMDPGMKDRSLFRMNVLHFTF
jgi:hypothetical protein